MSKYFVDEEMISLKDYFEKCLPQEEKMVSKLLTYLGDVTISKSLLEIFLNSCYMFSSMHIYEQEDEVICGIYKFCSKFPKLSCESTSFIASHYKKDIFEGHKVDEVLEKIIKGFGICDEAFKIFMMYLSEADRVVSKKYYLQAMLLDSYKDEYFLEEYDHYANYISFLKARITDEHIDTREVIKYMPCPDLIKKDIEYYAYLNQHHSTRIAPSPLSFLMTMSLAKGESMDIYGDQPIYYAVGYRDNFDAPFTTQEFMDSIEKRKEKIKKIGKK